MLTAYSQYTGLVYAGGPALGGVTVIERIALTAMREESKLALPLADDGERLWATQKPIAIKSPLLKSAEALPARIGFSRAASLEHGWDRKVYNRRPSNRSYRRNRLRKLKTRG